jgi:hypothetical protein
VNFYRKCRPPGLWKGIREEAGGDAAGEPTTGRLFADCLIGVAACFGLVVATNAVFAGDWPVAAVGAGAFLALGGLLLRRVFGAGGDRAAAPAVERGEERR